MEMESIVRIQLEVRQGTQGSGEGFHDLIFGIMTLRARDPPAPPLRSRISGKRGTCNLKRKRGQEERK
jgi:hypothetical protein